jgi:hypothetical protein
MKLSSLIACAIVSAVVSLAVVAAYDSFAPGPQLERAHVADIDKRVTTMRSEFSALTVTMGEFDIGLDDLRRAQEHQDPLPSPPPVHRTTVEPR